jgi:hypothetical protein
MSAALQYACRSPICLHYVAYALKTKAYIGLFGLSAYSYPDIHKYWGTNFADAGRVNSPLESVTTEWSSQIWFQLRPEPTGQDKTLDLSFSGPNDNDLLIA